MKKRLSALFIAILLLAVSGAMPAMNGNNQSVNTMLSCADDDNKSGTDDDNESGIDDENNDPAGSSVIVVANQSASQQDCNDREKPRRKRPANRRSRRGGRNRRRGVPKSPHSSAQPLQQQNENTFPVAGEMRGEKQRFANQPTAEVAMNEECMAIVRVPYLVQRSAKLQPLAQLAAGTCLQALRDHQFDVVNSMLMQKTIDLFYPFPPVPENCLHAVIRLGDGYATQMFIESVYTLYGNDVLIALLNGVNGSGLTPLASACSYTNKNEEVIRILMDWMHYYGLLIPVVVPLPCDLVIGNAAAGSSAVTTSSQSAPLPPASHQADCDGFVGSFDSYASAIEGAVFGDPMACDFTA